MTTRCHSNFNSARDIATNSAFVDCEGHSLTSKDPSLIGKGGSLTSKDPSLIGKGRPLIRKGHSLIRDNRALFPNARSLSRDVDGETQRASR
jgi:hypothetical protein